MLHSTTRTLACLVWLLGTAPVHSFQPITTVSRRQRNGMFVSNHQDRPEQKQQQQHSATTTALALSSPSSVDCHAAYNFGPASSRDSTVFSAERPGNDPDCKTTKVSNEQVTDWINFMKDQGVTNVIVLLDDNEFGIYDDQPGLLNIYEQQGMRYLWQSMDEPNASDKIYSFVRNVQESGGKVVTHCTGGIGRCGRVAAGWLVCEYGLSPEEATAETLKQAKSSGVTRAGNAEKLQAWLG